MSEINGRGKPPRVKRQRGAAPGNGPRFLLSFIFHLHFTPDRTLLLMLRRLLQIGLLVLTPMVFAPAAPPKNVFAAPNEAPPKMEKKIRFHQPLIEKGAKLTSASTDQYTFLRATLFRPGL